MLSDVVVLQRKHTALSDLVGKLKVQVDVNELRLDHCVTSVNANYESL